MLDEKRRTRWNAGKQASHFLFVLHHNCSRRCYVRAAFSLLFYHRVALRVGPCSLRRHRPHLSLWITALCKFDWKSVRILRRSPGMETIRFGKSQSGIRSTLILKSTRLRKANCAVGQSNKLWAPVNELAQRIPLT
jgi:hypothetical protein